MGKTKDINFADFRYISPSPAKGKGSIKHLRGKLKYFQYRNDKADHIAQGRGKARPERLPDMVLGGNCAEVLKAGTDSSISPPLSLVDRVVHQRQPVSRCGRLCR